MTARRKRSSTTEASFVAQTLQSTLAFFAVFNSLGCGAPRATAPLPAAARQLVVIPVFTDVAVSGFPVTERNAVTAAHSVSDWMTVVAVEGQPMNVLRPHGRGALPIERDWVQLFATRDRFRPNRVAPDVKLSAGDRVLIGGFPVSNPPADPVSHTFATPVIVEGRLLAHPPVRPGPCVLQVEVPAGTYYGFSGGPAAVVDDGEVVVWGVAVAEWSWRDLWPPWRRRTVLYVARLAKSEVDRMAGMKALNPIEAMERRSGLNSP